MTEVVNRVDAIVGSSSAPAAVSATTGDGIKKLT
jgi:hypothetical protein